MKILPAPRLVRWFLRATGYTGITLPPLAIYLLPERMNDDRLRRHEAAHWAQYRRMGAIRFYVTYLWLLARHGYRDHPMEVEARAAETA